MAWKCQEVGGFFLPGDISNSQVRFQSVFSCRGVIVDVTVFLRRDCKCARHRRVGYECKK